MARKKTLIIIGLVLLLISATSIFIFSKYQRVFVTPSSPKTGIIELPVATPTPNPLAPFSVLFLGYAGGNHDGALLTDSIILARIQPETQQIFLISVPRDLWVYLPLAQDELIPYKINSAYAWGSSTTQYLDRPSQYTGKAGGGQMAKNTLSKVLGVPVDNFVALDFQAFVKTIDILGGINVNVQKSFEDPLYPLEDPEIDQTCGKSEEEIAALTATMSGTKLEEQFPCRYETLSFERGVQLMDGITALKFARSRHSPTDGGDYNRSARQRLVIEAIKDRVFSINFLPKAIPFVNTLSYHLLTDLSLNDLQKLILKAEEYRQYEIVSYALTEENVLTQSRSANGQFILAPKMGETDYSQIHQTLSELFYPITPTPSPDL